jgi:hypothetical protein
MDEFGGFESMPGVDVLTDAYRISGPWDPVRVASPKS